MKRLILILPVILAMGCSSPINKEESYVEDEYNLEVIEALKELRSKYVIRIIELEEAASDRSAPKISNRIQEPSILLSEGSNQFIKSCEVAERGNISELDKEFMVKSAQEFTFNMIECLIKRKIERQDKLLDSMEFVTIIDQILPEYKQSYDTILIQRISDNFLSAKKQLSDIDLNIKIKDKIKVLMAQNKILKGSESIVVRLLGCNAAYANTGFEIFAKRLDSLSNIDSTTLIVRHTLVLDVMAAEINVEGIPGKGWVQDENYYYRFSTSDFKDQIRGRISFRSKSGQLRYKDFQTDIYQ